MITYAQNGSEVCVFLEKRIAGEIRKVAFGYQYWPKGVTDPFMAGEVLKTISAVKRSLEEND